MKKINKKGISLIVLIITIVIIIILTTTVIAMGLGPNGIITQAIRAKEENNLQVIKEELEMMFWDYNLYAEYEEFGDFLEAKVKSGQIESYKMYPIDGGIERVIKKSGYYFLVKDENGVYMPELLGTDLSNIGEGFTIITGEEF